MTTPPDPPVRPFQLGWQELQRQFATGPAPVTPLSEEEIEQLRERLTASGGMRYAMSASERAAWLRMGIVRDLVEVAAQQDVAQSAVARHVRMGTSPAAAERWAEWQYSRGVLDALHWACGAASEAPVSGQDRGGQPTVSHMLEEARQGAAVGEGRQESRRHRSYGIGVEAALLWLIGRSDTPPVSG